MTGTPVPVNPFPARVVGVEDCSLFDNQGKSKMARDNQLDSTLLLVVLAILVAYYC